MLYQLYIIFQSLATNSRTYNISMYVYYQQLSLSFLSYNYHLYCYLIPTKSNTHISFLTIILTIENLVISFTMTNLITVNHFPINAKHLKHRYQDYRDVFLIYIDWRKKLISHFILFEQNHTCIQQIFAKLFQVASTIQFDIHMLKK